MAQDTRIHQNKRIDQETRRARADAKIALLKVRMGKAGTSARQKAEDAQLINEMRHNKAAVDLNRTLFDFAAGAAEV